MQSLTIFVSNISMCKGMKTNDEEITTTKKKIVMEKCKKVKLHNMHNLNASAIRKAFLVENMIN